MWWLFEAARAIFAGLVRLLVRDVDPANAIQVYEQVHGVQTEWPMAPILTAAQTAVRVANNVQNLQPGRALQEALEGLVPPGEFVRVRLLVRAVDAHGNVVYRIVDHNQAWTSLVDDVLLLGQADAEALAAYHGFTNATVRIIPPLWFPLL